jgi:23S rRNA pseudouridine1911/1915/1917 synthase
MESGKDASALKEVRVLWEDRDSAALFKPPGLMVHPDGKSTEKTLCDFVVSRFPEAKDVGESLTLSDGRVVARPGIVHRLDRETSGVILIAKNQSAFLKLKKQFQGRTTRKIYNAFVYGRVGKEAGSINLPLGRSKGDFRQYAAPARARGEMREALTYFTRLEAKKDFSFLELIPKTGRTHQIRAHLKAIQHPVVCDRVYAKTKPCGLNFNRLALHARSITFKDREGKEVTVEAPLPPDFIEAKKIFDRLPE